MAVNDLIEDLPLVHFRAESEYLYRSQYILESGLQFVVFVSASWLVFRMGTIWNEQSIVN